MSETGQSTTSERTMELVTARLLANTRTKKRPDNLVDIARDIRWLESCLGSLRAVSELVGISVDMLNRFLSVESLTSEVKKVVEERKIDLINTVYYLRGFDAEAQRVIAAEVVADRLSGGDIRVLAPLHRSLPDASVAELVSRVQASRDKRVYVAYFRVPADVGGLDAVEKQLVEVVGGDGVVALSSEGQLATLTLTAIGLKRLRRAAREGNMSLRRFVDALVTQSGAAR